MEFVQLTQSQNDYFVHDIVFDYFGRRFATCSTDGKIRVWDFVDEEKSWTGAEISEAHNGAIWRLSWAHPEYGNLIASCSEDRTICVWEEQLSASTTRAADGTSRERWSRKVQLTDCKKPVNDVKFAPKQLGLKIGAACADGIVRIYDASDIFSLNYWQLQYSLQVEDTVVTDAVGVSNTMRHSEHGLTCLAWSDCVFEPAKIVVGGYSRRAVVWTFDGSSGAAGKWREECELDPSNRSGVIHDVAWAPAMGRSYHLIATASREKCFKIHMLQRNADGSLEYSSTHKETEVAAPVWRVAWNATGTVLAASAEDGSLSLWRRSINGAWKNVQNLPSGAEATQHFFTKT